MLRLSAAGANATSYTLTVTVNGTGSGTVTSTPAAITCKPTCSAAFTSGTQVKLIGEARDRIVPGGMERSLQGNESDLHGHVE